MKTDDFDYNLPEELIAQTPLSNRSESRLMVLKSNGEIEHKNFFNIIDYLNKGDALVINDTKVLPARIIGVKEETGAVIELLLLKDTGESKLLKVKIENKKFLGSIIEYTVSNNNKKYQVTELNRLNNSEKFKIGDSAYLGVSQYE